MGAHVTGVKGMSASTESISTVHKNGQSGSSSPSKLSMASSSDSIGSNASVATVKNSPGSIAAGTSSIVSAKETDNTPPLPPRNSPTRVIMPKLAVTPQTVSLVIFFPRQFGKNNIVSLLKFRNRQ